MAPGGSPGYEITYDETTAVYAEEFARVRTIDMCAMHDVAAAERVTGATASSLRLTTGLAECQLELSSDDPSSSWTFEVGFGPRLTADWTGMDLAGTPVRRMPGEGGACEYFAPTVDPVGLTIRAGHAQAAGRGPRPGRDAVCRTAERYLAEALLSRWSRPPTLDAGLTTPRIPLLGKDPCAALAAGVADVPDERGRGKAFSMNDPYSCQGARGSAISPYTVEFEVFSEILDLQGAPVQLGDFTAYPGGGVGAGSCSFQVMVQPDLVFSVTEGTVYHGGVVIGLPTCDDTTVAEKVIDDLVRQPDAPPAGPNAQLIGDLDGP
jgi:hypothetical protein